MTFNYERAQLKELTQSPYKIKLYDDAGESTKWLTITDKTFEIIKAALIEQGKES